MVNVNPPRPESLSPTQRARRERIVDKAYEFLMHHEYDDIQIREVADHAEVALGTVYRYFASKEHLFAAALVNWGAALRSRVNRSPLRGTEVSEQLIEIYLRAIDAFERRPQFYRAMTVIESTTDVHARELWREFSAVSSAAFDQPLAGLHPRTAAAVSNTLLPVLHGVLRAWANGSLPIVDARNRMRQAIELIFSPAPAALPSSAQAAVATASAGG